MHKGNGVARSEVDLSGSVGSAKSAVINTAKSVPIRVWKCWGKIIKIISYCSL